MPTDLTGTPTPLGIGTYNTSVDAPSGLGFNAAMSQIDALISARISTPSGIAAGEVPVWNGTTWARSSVTPMTANGITGVVKGSYRKSTSLQVINSVAETDLLNGEITIAANTLGTTGILRLLARGSILNNSGSAQSAPRWKLKFGGTTLLDTNVLASALATSTNAAAWLIEAFIANLGATNSQEAVMRGQWVGGIGTGGAAFFTTGTGGYVAPTGTSGLAEFSFSGRNPVTVDTTLAQALALTVTLGVANPSLAVSLTSASVELI